MKIVLTIIGAVLIVLVPIWVFFIVPYLEAIPVNYYRYEEQDGINSLSPYYGAPLPKPFKHHDTQEIKVLDVQGGNLKITSRLQAINLDSGQKFLDETRIYDVNRFSRIHVALEQGYFLFPPNTQQHDYFLTFPIGFTHAIYKFEGADVIQGLEVYVFTCKSDPYDITGAIPLFKDYKVKSLYTCKIWVEPVTGRDLDYQLSWESYYQQNGTFTLLAEKGNKETTPEYVAKFIEQAKNEKAVFQAYNQYIPLTILISGSVILITVRVFVNNKRQQSEIDKAKLFHNVKELEQIAKVTADEIVKSAKLITLGQLSANLSHDIRSGLQTLVTAVQLIEERNKVLPEEDKAELVRIKRIAERLSRQINDIMTFVRTTPIQLREISINEIVDSVLKRIDIPPNVRIVKPENNIRIYCDQTKLESVILNIVVNAIEVVGKNGEITISAEDTTDNSIISIQDSGTGILEGNLEKIFEPLFTTRSTGTGLGLAICKNIVEEHNGTIKVKNNPTTFTITLPKRKR